MAMCPITRVIVLFQVLLVLRLTSRRQPVEPPRVQPHRGADGPRRLQLNHSCKYQEPARLSR